MLFTPLKNNNNFFAYSSNKYKNLSSSSENILERIKEFSNNNNNNNNNGVNNAISSLFQLNNSNPKRKLVEEFNKSTMCKKNANDINNISNINNNQPTINNIKSNTNYNIINNSNFSFFIPNNKDDKENKNEKNTEKKTEIIKNNQVIIMDDTITHNNMFFTDYGLGYKCNCQKTQCNKYYCQCFREGRYCFNCNCVGCNNQKPKNCSSNKHQTEEDNKDKDKKAISITCTCTKSGCNKNYCECFKNKVKCNNLCRCRNCENCEEGKIEKNKNLGSNNYECCLTDSVFIVNNKIVLEDINKNKIKIERQNEPISRKIKLMINDNIISSFSSDENENVGHKRKREDEKEMDIENNMSNNMNNKKSKISDNHTVDSIQVKKNEEDESSGELFDKNGKLILTNFQL